MADRNVFGNIVGSLAALALSHGALWLVADNAILAVIMIVLVGASGFSIAGALNAQVFQIATQAPTPATSVNTSAFKVGNALGLAVGVCGIAVGFGPPATVVAAIVLALSALVMVAVAIRVERSWARRSETTLAGAAHKSMLSSPGFRRGSFSWFPRQPRVLSWTG